MTVATTVVNIRGRHREHAGAAPLGVVYIGDHAGRGGWKLTRSVWFNRFKMDVSDRPGTPAKKRDGTREEVVSLWDCHGNRAAAESGFGARYSTAPLPSNQR